MIKKDKEVCMSVELKHNYLKLQITKLYVLKMVILGFVGLVGTILGVFYFSYLLYRLFITNNLRIIIFIFKHIDMIGILSLLYVILWISSIGFLQGISDLKFLIKHQGVIFKMDAIGIQYYNFETKMLKKKDWSVFEDVGCFRQQTEKLIYKYQIKFTDGDIYDFDLRGTIAVTQLKEKVEEFYLKYSA